MNLSTLINSLKKARLTIFAILAMGLSFAPVSYILNVAMAEGGGLIQGYFDKGKVTIYDYDTGGEKISNHVIFERQRLAVETGIEGWLLETQLLWGDSAPEVTRPCDPDICLEIEANFQMPLDQATTILFDGFYAFSEDDCYGGEESNQAQAPSGPTIWTGKDVNPNFTKGKSSAKGFSKSKANTGVQRQQPVTGSFLDTILNFF